ncbi:MAG: hypothetical protein NTV62_00370 [Candidatus Gribaldobacteria bacterium]|nr:hypothetical protein [Candidatus Gribaldobacteria bacterium]
MQKRILLVAHDVGPSMELNILADGLQSANFTVEGLLGFGKHQNFTSDTLWEKVSDNSLIVVGLSSYENDAEIEEKEVIVSASRLNKPIIVACDTFGVYSRPWLLKMIHNMGESRFVPKIVFVSVKGEVSKAQVIFPDSKIIRANPMFEDFHFPKINKEQALDHLKTLNNGKIGEKIILVPLSKDRLIGTILVAHVIDVTKNFEDVSILMCLHPADVEGEKYYQQFVDRNKKLKGKQKLIITNVGSTQFLELADLVVCVAGGTIGIMAACRRIPAVCLDDETLMGHLESIIGTRKWYPCEVGANYLSVLNEALVLRLLDPKGPIVRVCSGILEAQAREFPRPERLGIDLEIMVSEIQKLLS